MKDKLGQLRGRTAAERDGGRLLDLAGPGDGTAAILREIDETVLGRELDFTNDAGAVLGLDVSGRRLLRVRSVPDAAFAALAGQALSGTRDETAATLHGLIERFAGTSAALTVTARKLARRPQVGEELGCAPAALAEAWQVSLTAPPRGGGLDGFLATAAPLSRAWFVLDGDEITDQAGDDALLQRLYAAAEAGIPLPEPEGGDAEAPVCLIQRGPDPDAPAVLFGAAGARSLLMLFPPDRLRALRLAWRRAFG
ncbi:hypothetical protein [Acidimangrovimonas pyrenivorans]|uniref:Uncharacterized protein n=1 Tax=Acidimangrovimonas pyrenivorans TaxID=2030798 RepID=A0ABV7AFZ3_9RHOB